MPAATKLSQIKNISEAVERALMTVHTAVGGTAIIQRSEADNDDLWITPIFNLGPASGHRFKRPDGYEDFDIFENCLIEFQLNVPRLASFNHATFTATYTLLDQEITRVLFALDPVRWAALNAALPYHQVNRLYPQGHHKGYNPDTKEDIATISFRCRVGILPEAWPTDPQAYLNPVG